jgi:hypothetical protein
MTSSLSGGEDDETLEPRYDDDLDSIARSPAAKRFE